MAWKRACLGEPCYTELGMLLGFLGLGSFICETGWGTSCAWSTVGLREIEHWGRRE